MPAPAADKAAGGAAETAGLPADGSFRYPYGLFTRDHIYDIRKRSVG